MGQSNKTTRKPDEEQILIAISNGNLNSVRNLIKTVGPNRAVDGLYPLTLASQDGHTDIVQFLVQNKADITITDINGNTALHTATYFNRFDICKILIENGADINKQNKDKWTPIIIAAANGLEDILKYLVGRTDANLNIRDSDNQTPLHNAVIKSQIASVEILLTFGADAKALDNNGESPFHLVARIGNERILKLFLDKKAASLIDTQDENKRTALHFAVLENNQECLKLLIEYNADKNIRDMVLKTPLNEAVRYNRLECVKILVESGADLHLSDIFGNTPLHLAVITCSMKLKKDIEPPKDSIHLLPDCGSGPDISDKIIMYLVENDASLNIKNKNGMTPLDLCDDPIIRKSLISFQSERQEEEESSHGLNIGDEVIIGLIDLEVIIQMQRGYGGWTSRMNECMLNPNRIVTVNTESATVRAASGNIYQINLSLLKKYEGERFRINNIQRFLDATKQLDEALLIVAIREGDLGNVRNLIEIVGPNIAVNGVYPLLLASNFGHSDIVQLLILNKADVNVTDMNGDTALHIAVGKNKFDTCKILVENGADINIQNNKKVTPVMIAAISGHKDILEYLAGRNETNLNIGNSENQTALHLSVRSSQIASVETLLTCGADAKALDCNKLSPFHIASLRGNERIIKVFLEKRAASLVDTQNEDKLGAIHFAVLRDNQECLKLLIEYKADKNIRDKNMNCPLHYAVICNRFECVKILVESGAELNLKDSNGNTPLHLAACTSSRNLIKNLDFLFGFEDGFQLFPNLNEGPDNSRRIITYLVANGAFLYITNSDEKIPLELCLDPILKAVLISLESQRQHEEELREIAEVQELRNNINQMRDQDKCKICKERSASILFQCGHKSCNDCSNRLSRCYNCGVSIERRIEMKF